MKKKYSSLLLSSCILLVFSMAVMASIRVQSEFPTVRNLRGWLHSTGCNTPIEGATIIVMSGEIGAEKEITRITTDRDGFFSWPNSKSGKYYLYTKADGYVTIRVRVKVSKFLFASHQYILLNTDEMSSIHAITLKEYEKCRNQKGA